MNAIQSVVWLLMLTGLQAQRYPQSERYDRPKPYHPYPEEAAEHETAEDYPCALVVPGLPGKSAAVDRYHYAK